MEEQIQKDAQTIENLEASIKQKEEELNKIDALSKEYQRLLEDIKQLREERRKLLELQKEEAKSIYWDFQEKQVQKAIKKLVEEFPEAQGKEEQILATFQKLGSESIDFDEIYQDVKKSYLVVDYDNFAKKLGEQKDKEGAIQTHYAQQSSASLGGIASSEPEPLDALAQELVSRFKKTPEEAKKISEQIKSGKTYFSKPGLEEQL